MTEQDAQNATIALVQVAVLVLRQVPLHYREHVFNVLKVQLRKELDNIGS